MTPQNLSRRAFLKGGLKVAATMAAATGTATVASAALPQDSEESLVTLIDITKCIGCEECVHACRASEPEKYPDPKKPFPKMVPSRVPVEDWSDKKDVTHRLTPYNWLYIQEAAAMVDGEETIYNIPRRCMHC
ncbi:MAG: 4Fe-4S dicluster domain-containing protein, partial [Desulfobacterales bacterium]|nr:4Fe-4S dicluster domain-containing protein [Desulfobacterales bacterium]